MYMLIDIHIENTIYIYTYIHIYTPCRMTGVTLHRGGPRELGTAKALLDALVDNNRAWIWVMFGYESFQNATQYITGTSSSLHYSRLELSVTSIHAP